MERLTSRCDGRPALAQGLKERFTEQSLFYMLLDRLAAYEDTGLEPEDVAELVSPKTVEIARLLEKMCTEGSAQHMLELFQAGKDGRLVVMPCKVGDEAFVDVRTLPYHYLHPADGCIDYAKCEIVSIVTTRKETYMKLRALYPSRANRREYLRYGVAAVGKTVFLTEEEAEAALKKREGT